MDDPNKPLADTTPDEVDDGLAFAYGADSRPDSAPSALDRVRDLTGRKPQVSLRDAEVASQTPMLKPLGPDDARSAGRYLVHGVLGQGGVGTVHRGHDQDLGRDVALKFLNEKYASEPAILHRFVEEAQIGGQLQHPGIVPVYELGMAEGRPFFAMKMVKGQTLAKKLADRTSPAQERRTFLAIFEDICQTIAYAHARGVVHRDLKPANVMIGSFGEVQVVDWGMGKVLLQGGVADEEFAAERSKLSVIETVRSQGHGSRSVVGSVMGTPAYMPPEQARGAVEQMDERSDVFALGAILCEILTGLPPYVGEQRELIGMAALAKLDDAHERLGTCGAEQDLVELATRCLMPAPAARPQSAQQVAEAVHAHLAAAEERVHQANVEAAAAKVRAAALKRTQRLGLSLTLAIVAALLVASWNWRRAEEQTEVATRELARAVEIKRLLEGMLNGITPEKAKGRDTALLEDVLAATSKRLDEGAIEDDLVAAELHAVTGGVYRGIGKFAEAEQHLSAAAALRTRVLGAEDERTLGTYADLAALYGESRRDAEAEELLLRNLAVQKRALGQEHSITVGTLCNLATLYGNQGRFDEAEALTRRTLEIRRRTVGPEHATTLASMNNLAALLKQRGRSAEAEALMRETLEIQERVLGPESPSAIAGMGNLALLLSEQNRFAEAEELTRRTLELKRGFMREDHPSTIETMSDLAALYARQGRSVEAEALMRETLAIQARSMGEENVSTLRTMNNLATVLRTVGRYDEAEALHLRTLEIQRRVLSAEHPETLASMDNLAVLYRLRGRLDEAERMHLDCLEIEKRVLGPDHCDTLMTMGNLASVYGAQGRHAEAEALFLETIEADERELGLAHSQTLGAMTHLGQLYNSMGRFEDAAALFETCLPRQQELLGPLHWWTSQAANGLGNAYYGMGLREKAQRTMLVFVTARAEDPRADATVLNEAAWFLLTIEPESLGDPARALAWASRAVAMAEQTSGPLLWNALDTLALAQHRTGDNIAAVATQKRALDLMPEDADPGLALRLAEYEAAQRK